MVGGFRHKGLEEIYLTGKTRRIGIEYARKCIRILQSLEMATQPEQMNVAGTGSTACAANRSDGPFASAENYRITFGWSGENAHGVDFEDYH